MIQVNLEDHTGNKTRQAKMSETAPVAKLIPALVSALGLPATDPAGRAVAYHLSFNGRHLEEQETLQTAGVRDGDRLSLVPEFYGVDFSDSLVRKAIDIFGGVYDYKAAEKKLLRETYTQGGAACRSPWATIEEFRPLIPEIASAVIEAFEARTLVKIVGERPFTEEERKEAEGTLIVRPVFGKPDLSEKYKSDVFMIMPFAEQFQSIYEDYIKPTVEACNLTIRRGDDFFSHHNIIDEIWSGIAGSRFVIADCTGRNANVFYELGLAHTLGKPAITITQEVADLPFDIQGRRAIEYKESAKGLKTLQEKLREAIALLGSH